MKKILSLLLIATLMMTAFVGCFQKEEEIEVPKELTAKELFEEAMDKNQEVTNASFLMDMTLDLSSLEDLGVAGPIGIVATGDVKDEKNMAVKLNVDLAGQPIDAALYLKDDKFLVQSSFFSVFFGSDIVTADLAALSEATGTPINQPNADEVLDIVDRFAEATEYSLYDIFQLADTKEKVSLSINEATVDTTKLTAKIDISNSDEMLFEFMKFILEDEEAKALFYSNMTEIQLAELEAALNDADTMAEISDAIDMFKFNEFSIDMYLDSELRVVAMDMVMDMAINDPTTGESITMAMTAHMEYFNYGNVKDIEFPEYDPASVFDLGDLVN